MEAPRSAVPTTAVQLLNLLNIPFGTNTYNSEDTRPNLVLGAALNVYQSGSRGVKNFKKQPMN
jgi:hypothetical protein